MLNFKDIINKIKAPKTQPEPVEEVFDKYHYDPNKFIDDRTIPGKIDKLSYMQTSLILGALAVVLFIFCMVLAVGSGGDVNISTGLLGVVAFFIALAGIAVTVYGHFFVQMDGKLKWFIGLIPNGIIALAFLVLYIIGLA